VSDHLGLLLQLYVRPMRAMSSILDRGNWLFGVIAAVVLTYALSFVVASRPMHAPNIHRMPHAAAPNAGPPPTPAEVVRGEAISATTALTVFCVFVPLAIGFITLFEGLGHFGTILSRDFAPLLACCSMAWIAAEIPAGAAAAIAGAAGWQLWVYIGCAVFFLLLMVCAVSVVFGAGAPASAGAVLLAAGATGLVAASGIFDVLIGLVASPLFLLYGFWYFSGSFRNAGQGLRSRQAFRRMLEAAAINPHDADAQCQLGLIYQARRQYDLAADHFRKALQIDPKEPEALLQLGRILRDRGQPAEALKHFQALAQIDPKFSSHEVWREAGSVYIALGRFNDARPVLEHYITHREYDAEALYYLGQTLEAQKDYAGAADAFSRSVEAAATAPRHRRRFVSRWGRLAQRKLRDVKRHAIASAAGR
jgi:Flp pilus assembly protein TadD